MTIRWGSERPGPRSNVINKRLHAKINSQEKLIAELYYAWDLKSVRSRIRRYMKNSDIARKTYLEKVNGL